MSFKRKLIPKIWGGRKLQDFFSSGNMIGENEQQNYKYPDIESIYKSGLKGIYLNNFFLWDPLRQNSKMIKHGFKPQKNSKSFDIYERAGSSVYYNFHDYTKLINVNYTKIRDHLSREIRHGRIDRNTALSLEKNVTFQESEFNNFFQWLEVTKSGIEWYFKYIYKKKMKTNLKNLKVSKKIKNLLKKSFKSKKEFCVYEKEI